MQGISNDKDVESDMGCDSRSSAHGPLPTVRTGTVEAVNSRRPRYTLPDPRTDRDRFAVIRDGQVAFRCRKKSEAIQFAIATGQPQLYEIFKRKSLPKNLPVSAKNARIHGNR